MVVPVYRIIKEIAFGTVSGTQQVFKKWWGCHPPLLLCPVHPRPEVEEVNLRPILTSKQIQGALAVVEEGCSRED